MEIQFKAGDKVRRKAGNRDSWWKGVCLNYNVEPDAILEVVDQHRNCGILLKELKKGYEYAGDYFELVKDAKESEMEKAYALAKSLIGKKIVCDDDGDSKYTVTGVIFRQDKTDNAGLSFPCETFLNDNGWIVGVKFNNMNYPVQRVKEVPSDISVELNGSYTAVVSKGSVKVGCQTFPIEKIQEIIDAHNKL